MVSIRVCITVLTVYALTLPSKAARQRTASDVVAAAAVNPIRKIITMLENIKRKVESEGETEENLYKKFECYCGGSRTSLQKEVEEAGAKTSQLESDVSSFKAKKEQIDDQLKENQASQDDASRALSKATSIHEKTHEALEEHKAEDEVSIKALDKTIVASKRAGFLQTADSASLRLISAREDVPENTRSQLAAFLDGGRTDSDSDDPGAIEEALKGIRATINEDEEKTVKEETEEAQEYEALSSAKKKELSSLEQQIQSKTTLSGELAVDTATTENELEDTLESLMEDKKLQARMVTICTDKKKEFEDNVRMRSMELKALADTITMLNSDDSLELLKKSLPTPSDSFLQVTASFVAKRARALAILRQIGSPSAHLDLLSLALHGKNVGLQKVLKMIDDMMDTIKKEQADDEAKKQYCEKELDSADDEKKQNEREISDTKAAMEKASEELNALDESIKSLKDGIAALDKSLADATEQRKEESAEFHELMATNAAAKELLGKAKERLAKFYNAPPPASFAQVASDTLRTRAPPEAPETAKHYSKSQGGGSVISALQTIIADLENEMAVGKKEEEQAQEMYDRTMKESADKRMADVTTLEEETSRKADLKARLHSHQSARTGAEDELAAVKKHIAALHSDCDSLAKFFDARTRHRTEEMDGFKKARAILASSEV